ncbi:MAG: hypothetical protein KAV80_01990, partial [Methanomicrobia archaeon]|nr:hypothetical protein [Methanomicrobia archaeon]
MDLPYGDIIVEATLDLVNLENILSSFKDSGYLCLLSKDEEIYLILEKGKIVNVFYEGKEEGSETENFQKILLKNPTLTLHKLTEMQMDIIKEVYGAKEYTFGELFRKKIEIKEEVKEEVKKEVKEEEPGPIRIRKPKVLEFVGDISKITTDYVEEGIITHPHQLILKFIDGEKTIDEIVKKSGFPESFAREVILYYIEKGLVKY